MYEQQSLFDAQNSGQVESVVITPAGCWNCCHATIPEDKERPIEYRPGTLYWAGCASPRNPDHATGSRVMTEERPELPMCEWYETL